MSVPLADPLVLLRRWKSSDAEPLYAAARESIDEVGRWLPWCHGEYSIEDSRNWVRSRSQAWEAGTEYSFAIIERSSGRLVGGCGLNQIEPSTKRANLGYWTRTSATGRNYSTSAARILAQFGLLELGFERLEIVAAAENIASQRVALKAGAKREGTARRRVRIRDVQHDAVIFSLIREDLAEAQGDKSIGDLRPEV